MKKICFILVAAAMFIAADAKAQLGVGVGYNSKHNNYRCR